VTPLETGFNGCRCWMWLDRRLREGDCVAVFWQEGSELSLLSGKIEPIR
jgi:hypothetical protein